VAAVHHAIGAHALAAAAVGGGGIAAVAYLDHEQMKQWYSENPPAIDLNRTVKFAIGGKLLSGEFVTVAQNQPTTAVLQGYMDKATNEILKSRIIQPKALGSGLANDLSKGMVVYA
jgi:hypothetical protein